MTEAANGSAVPMASASQNAHTGGEERERENIGAHSGGSVEGQKTPMQKPTLEEKSPSDSVTASQALKTEGEKRETEGEKGRETDSHIGQKRPKNEETDAREIIEASIAMASAASATAAAAAAAVAHETQRVFTVSADEIAMRERIERRQREIQQHKREGLDTPQPVKKKPKAPKLITPLQRLSMLRGEYECDLPVLRASDDGKLWCIACKRHFRIDMSSIRSHLDGPRHILNREKAIEEIQATEASLSLPMISPITDTLASGSLMDRSEIESSATAIPPPVNGSQGSDSTSEDLLVVPMASGALSHTHTLTHTEISSGSLISGSPATLNLSNDCQTQSDGQRSKPRVLLCASGSVAAVKIPLLMAELSQWADVRLISTEFALHFFDATHDSVSGRLFRDRDEWATFSKLGDPVLHINLRAWADALVIAPLSANTLAKVANGLCDNLLTCVVRAWDWQQKPLLLCPSMNTLMWSHPITAEHLQKITSFSTTGKVHTVPPISKRLACGDMGVGAMEEVSVISLRVRQALGLPMQT